MQVLLRSDTNSVASDESRARVSALGALVVGALVVGALVVGRFVGCRVGAARRSATSPPVSDIPKVNTLGRLFCRRCVRPERPDLERPDLERPDRSICY